MEKTVRIWWSGFEFHSQIHKTSGSRILVDTPESGRRWIKLKCIC